VAVPAWQCGDWHTDCRLYRGKPSFRHSGTGVSYALYLCVKCMALLCNWRIASRTCNQMRRPLVRPELRPYAPSGQFEAYQRGLELILGPIRVLQRSGDKRQFSPNFRSFHSFACLPISPRLIALIVLFPLVSFARLTSVPLILPFLFTSIPPLFPPPVLR
jgi:hypothetical protein